MPPNLLTEATPGNREGLARAFGHAAAWLKAPDHAPPAELAVWLAERLESLSNVLHDKSIKKFEHAVPAALGLVHQGKRGRKSRSSRDDAMRRFLVWDCSYAKAMNPHWTWKQVFDHVVAKAAEAKLYISADVVEAAWKDRRELVPDLPPTEFRK